MDNMVWSVTVIPEETGPRINRVSSPGNSTVNAVFAWLEIQTQSDPVSSGQRSQLQHPSPRGFERSSQPDGDLANESRVANA